MDSLHTLQMKSNIKKPEFMLFDIDTTLLATYGNQEAKAFNYHYQANGYHPLLCFDGLTGDLLKAELRDGTKYCSNGAGEFMGSLLLEYRPACAGSRRIPSD